MEKQESDAENNENSEKFAIQEIYQILTDILNEISENNVNAQLGVRTKEEGEVDEEEENDGKGEYVEKNYEQLEDVNEKVDIEVEQESDDDENKDDLMQTTLTEVNIIRIEDDVAEAEELCADSEINKFCTQITVDIEATENNENIIFHCDPTFNVRIIEERLNTARIDWDLFADADVYKIEKFHRRRGWEQVAWTGTGPTTINNLDENFNYRLRIKAQRFCEIHGMFEDYKMSPDFLVTTLPPLPTTLSLHRAIKKGQQFLVKRILRRRPSLLEYPGPNGYLPLANAIICDQHSVTDVLLSHGANVQIGNPINARTPLQLAFYHGRLAVARILLNRKALLEATDINDMTACHFAVDANQLELLRFALENDANVNATDACGWSLLSRAVVMRADICILKLLLTHGANVKSKDKLNKTCVDLAKIYKNTIATDYFAKTLRAKMDVNGKCVERIEEVLK